MEGSRICYVGPKKDEMPVFEREIDLDGDVLMPYVDAFFKKVDIESGAYISPIPGFFKEDV